MLSYRNHILLTTRPDVVIVLVPMENPKRDPNRDTRTHVLIMYRAGVPVARIALALDISATRAYKILQELRKSGELEEQTA